MPWPEHFGVFVPNLLSPDSTTGESNVSVHRAWSHLLGFPLLFPFACIWNPEYSVPRCRRKMPAENLSSWGDSTAMFVPSQSKFLVAACLLRAWAWEWTKWPLRVLLVVFCDSRLLSASFWLYSPPFLSLITIFLSFLDTILYKWY